MNQLPISDITLRDYFAGQVVAALITDGQCPNVWQLSADAYKVADAMIEERNRDSA